MNIKKEDINDPCIFLCLSGGGFRAAVFHYGCLKRLYEVGLLGRVDAVSATSGGSVAAALLLQNAVGQNTKKGSHTYDWLRFERQLLNLVLRGTLGPVTRLVAAYVFYAMAVITGGMALIGVMQSWLPLVASLTLGLGLHSSLIYWARKNLSFAQRKEDRWMLDYLMGAATSIDGSPNAPHFMKVIFYPSVLRIETMNALVFSGKTMDILKPWPKIYLTAVNLNDGREMVFSQGITAPLNQVGCRALWVGRSSWMEYVTPKVEISTAVAASSAFPPVFKPVPVYNDDRLIGVFSDGGVVDNLAIKVAEALAVHAHSERQHFNLEASGLESFKDRIKLVLLLDGSRPLAEKQWRSWWRWSTVWRLIDTVSNKHGIDAEIAAYNFERNMDIHSAIVSLRVGFPVNDKLSQTSLPGLICRIRTHFDSFTLQECAVLAYSGYTLIDDLLRDKSALFKRMGLMDTPAAKPFEAILPSEAGQWNADLTDVCKTLRASHHRVRLLRWCRRTFGI